MNLVFPILITITDSILLILTVMASAVGLTTSSETLRKSSIGFLVVMLVILIISR